MLDRASAAEMASVGVLSRNSSLHEVIAIMNNTNNEILNLCVII
jgi:hypothetical protein